MPTRKTLGEPAKKILVIDDGQDVRFLIQQSMMLEGFAVDVAPDGSTALAMLNSSDTRPDLVVLDVRMPHMDGWDTLASIRHNPSTRTLRVIMCTAKGEPADLVRGWLLDCDGYIAKPFSVKDLAALVREIIARDEPARRTVREAGLAEARSAAAAP